ncbi:MAG TPA: TonB-dependent receptor, partial [Ignavibacteria bacterium]|nr:TonB-dependent receptor [Ignavibacteria bacterium]
MIRYLIVFTALIAFSTNAFDIKGRVTDLNDGKGIEADVKLYIENDSALVKGTRCSPQGEFTLDGLSSGTYRIEVSAMEYSTHSMNNISVGSSDVVLDTIRLKKQNVTTEEILVEEEKGLIQFSADKKIFNVSKSIITKGGTAIDVLKKTPLVDVDMDDNVSLRGSRNVKILIDDKPMRYASLKQVPADAIERIELITNPSAKYEAEGVTGIINIVLKKNGSLGVTGSFNGGGNYSEKFSGWGGVDINLKKKKITTFGNLYSGTWANNSSYNSRANYFTEPSSLIVNGNGNNHGYWLWGQGGFEYDLSLRSAIGFEGSIGTGKWYNKDNSINNSINNSGNLTSYYDQDREMDGLWQNFTGSLYFNSKLNDEGREWTGDITLSTNRNDMFLRLNKQDYDSLSVPVNYTPLDQRDSTIMKSYNLNVQTDYTHPFTKETKIEAGYKGTFRLNDNDFSSDTLDHSINNYVTNTGLNNRFKLNEYIDAVYAMFSSTIGSFSYKFGVRGEHTYTKGELVSSGNTFTQNYVDFFPTVNLSQKIGEYHQLQLSYSRRITRPNIWRMNPFYRKFNERYIMVGNPELKPEYTDSYELSFMFYTAPITVTPLLFFRQSHDVISSYSYLQDSVVAVSTFRNTTGSKAYGLDLLLNSRAFGWLSLNGTLSFYKTKFDSDPSLTDYAAEEGFSWKANVRSTLSFPGLFNVELFYQYTGEKVNFQGTDLPTSNFDIGISKSFFKDAFTVSL